MRQPHTPRKAANPTTQPWLGCWAPARIRAGAPDSSVSRLSDRPAVAFATEAQPARTSSQIWSHANTTDSFENITSLSSPHGGASTAAFKVLLGYSKERPVGGLQETPCHYLKKLANSLGKWPYSIPPLSTMQAELCHIRAS